MKSRRIYLLVLVSGLAFCLIPFRSKVKSVAVSMIQVFKGRTSVTERVTQFGGKVHKRLATRFGEIGVSYPPKKIILVGLKQERILEVWLSNEPEKFSFLKAYPILAASGTLGPKLAEG